MKLVQNSSKRRHRHANRRKNKRDGRPFRKRKCCRCGLCFIIPGTSFFIAFCVYYYVTYIYTITNSDEGASSSNSLEPLYSRVQKLPTGLPSRSAFIIINLAKRKDRWECVSKEFKRENVIVEKFIATDASQIFTQDKRHENIMKLTIISDNAKNRLVNDIGINTGHLATFISHTNAMHTILNRELKFGCIFEDDVTLKPNFLKEFSMLYKELPKDWDIFLLNQFCHQSGCEINNALKPISKHLMPVKMFYSGAGYCLNANSARKILSTLPCEHKSYCTIAIDAYMGFLVKEGFLKAYRPKKKMVLIPQDLMRMKDYQINSNECFSSFDSDIVKFWKPENGPRNGHGCVFNYIASMTNEEQFFIHMRSNRKTYIIPPPKQGTGNTDVTGLYVETVEGDIVIARNVKLGSILNHPVENVDNTFFLFANKISVIVSSDLWRGVSIVIHNSGGTTVEFYWRYEVSGYISKTYKDIYLMTLLPKKTYHSYLPNKNRILVAKYYGARTSKISMAKQVIFKQPLNVYCHANAEVVEIHHNEEKVNDDADGENINNNRSDDDGEGEH